jgi:hypothetical protein
LALATEGPPSLPFFPSQPTEPIYSSTHLFPWAS